MFNGLILWINPHTAIYYLRKLNYQGVAVQLSLRKMENCSIPLDPAFKALQNLLKVNVFT